MFEVTKNGPFSMKRPNKDVAPGPPCNHNTTGASFGLCYDKYSEN